MLSLSEWRRAFLYALAIWLLSWGLVRVGIWYGHTLPTDQGYPAPGAIQDDLFRFDAVYYYDLARDGYHYNGNPASSPNIVFAPLYPLLIAVVDTAPWVSTVAAGFVLNKLLFLAALTLLFAFLRTHFDGRSVPALTVLAALATAAGSYSFHAYYSESTMLLCLSAALLCLQRRWWIGLALASAALGASRLAALPFVFVFAIVLLREAYRQRQIRMVALAALAPLGAVAYLTYIALTFGNPFTLLPEIQSVSWGLFHPETDTLKLLSGAYLVQDIAQVFTRSEWLDIRTLNLAWMLLALVGTVHSLIARPREAMSWAFAAYFVFVYATGAGSEYLISSHRFFVFLLPIYFFVHALTTHLPRYTSYVLITLLFLMNALFAVLHTAMFNQGVWYWF